MLLALVAVPLVLPSQLLGAVKESKTVGNGYLLRIQFLILIGYHLLVLYFLHLQLLQEGLALVLPPIQKFK